MSKPEKNIPKVIYLQIGEDCEEKDFSDLEGITWCEDRINKNDIRYILDKRQIQKGGKRGGGEINGRMSRK